MGRPGEGNGGTGGFRPAPPNGGNGIQGRAGAQRRPGSGTVGNSGSGGTGGFRPTPPTGGSAGAQRPNTPRPNGGGMRPPSNNGRPPAGGRPPSGGMRSPGGRPGAPAGRGVSGRGAPPPRNGRGAPPSRNGQRLPPPPPRPNRSRYSPPPPSPKRPKSYGRNNGCVNMVIGGVVVAIVLLIVLLNVLRNSCTGCSGNTSSDTGSSTGTSSSVSNTGGNSQSSGSSQSGSQSGASSPENSSGTAVTPPPAPAAPVLTLERNTPENAFISECVTDELGWFDDVKAAGESLKFVYDKLGIQPYVVFRKYDADLKSDAEKVQFCVDWYKSHITDEDTFLLMYFAEKESSSDIGYTVYYSGANAEVLAAEFRGILEEGFNEYWFTELSTDKVIEYAFQYTCNRIAIKKPDESTSTTDTSSSDDPTTEEPTTEETDDKTDTSE